MVEKKRFLKHYFGHDAFRNGQEPLIDAIMGGRDALGVMPTGAGKSVCYQLPAVMLPGTTLVISPLISLMKDQVAALTAMGIPAACINSMLTSEEYSEALWRAERGDYKILYVAPERLTSAGFQRLCQSLSVPLVAVDEAHCVSQWGQDFRPSYLDISGFIEGLPRRPVVGAFTATATDAVKADIIKLLALRDPVCVTTGFDRPNLFFDVKMPRDKFSWVLDYVRRHGEQAGIVYCATRKAVDQTWGLVLTDGGEICDARFSKCCGGRTELFSTCWEDKDLPYLQSFPDTPGESEGADPFCDTSDEGILSQVLNDFDLETKDFFRWKTEYSREEISELVHRRSGIDFGQIADLIPVERGPSGRLKRLRIVGEKGSMVIGKELIIRKWLSESHLKSSAFEVSWKGDRLILEGSGWGHGVGLCQIGAAVMGARGYGYDEILRHYYPGATIKRI